MVTLTQGYMRSKVGGRNAATEKEMSRIGSYQKRVIAGEGEVKSSPFASPWLWTEPGVRKGVIAGAVRHMR